MNLYLNKMSLVLFHFQLYIDTYCMNFSGTIFTVHFFLKFMCADVFMIYSFQSNFKFSKNFQNSK